MSTENGKRRWARCGSSFQAVIVFGQAPFWAAPPHYGQYAVRTSSIACWTGSSLEEPVEVKALSNW